MSFIRRTCLSFVFICACFSCVAQEALRKFDLSNLEPAWTAVIGGVSVSPAVETSYGIAVLTDGRLLSACTNSGKVIWQKHVSGRPTPYISAFGDFLFVVTDKKKLNMINPSGSVIWSSTCPFEITDVPVSGSDGRVFVRGERGIACFGLNGVRKWHVETEELASFKPLLLNDGSILVFQKKLRGGYQIGMHFSPFGEKIEEQTFSGEITAACPSVKGLLVAVKNSSVGLVSVSSDGKIGHRWSIPLPSGSRCYAASYRETSASAAFFVDSGGSTRIFVVDCDKGEVINEIKIGSFNASNIQIAKSTVTGFLVGDTVSASECYEDGTILWKASLPDKKGWDHVCYTRANYLFICKKDWSMAAFKMAHSSVYAEQYSTPRTKSYIKLRPINSVNNEYNIKTFSDGSFSTLADKLSKGDYGASEKELLEDIKYEAYNYYTSLNSRERFATKNSYFADNPLYTEQVFNLMAMSGTSDFSSLIADMLKNEGNFALTLPLLSCAGEYGFDPDGEILDSFEILLSRIPSGDAVLLKALCDATYRVCAFMGRPAFSKKGKDILTKLMYPSYSRVINLYARSTLEKMVQTEQKL